MKGPEFITKDSTRLFAGVQSLYRLAVDDIEWQDERCATVTVRGVLPDAQWQIDDYIVKGATLDIIKFCQDVPWHDREYGTVIVRLVDIFNIHKWLDTPVIISPPQENELMTMYATFQCSLEFVDNDEASG